VASVAPLQPRVETAFADASFSRPFVVDGRAAGVPALDRWLDAMDPVIQARLAFNGGRPRSTRRSITDPLGVPSLR